MKAGLQILTDRVPPLQPPKQVYQEFIENLRPPSLDGRGQGVGEVASLQQCRHLPPHPQG
jgi:hypothetical protein